jgi:hypothetical protein
MAGRSSFAAPLKFDSGRSLTAPLQLLEFDIRGNLTPVLSEDSDNSENSENSELDPLL